MTVKSFSLDDDVAAYIETRENQSEFVNRVVRRVMEGYDPEAVIIDYQIEEHKGRLAEAESRTDAIKDRIAELESRKEQHRELGQSVVREFVETASDSVPADPENDAIINWANKTTMTPEEFAEAVAEERNA